MNGESQLYVYKIITQPFSPQTNRTNVRYDVYIWLNLTLETVHKP